MYKYPSNENEVTVKSAIAGVIASSLNAKEIKKCYVASDNWDDGIISCMLENCVMVFHGLLHVLAREYIDRKKLVPGNEEYDKIINTLAQLSGLTNGYYPLNDAEYEKVNEMGYIPVNADAQLSGSIDPKKPIDFINKELFIYAISFIWEFVYCTPENKRNKLSFDGDLYKNMLKVLAVEAQSAYLARHGYNQRYRYTSAQQYKTVVPEPVTGKKPIDLGL